MNDWLGLIHRTLTDKKSQALLGALMVCSFQNRVKKTQEHIYYKNMKLFNNASDSDYKNKLLAARR
ncbi:MAG TPA: hypothetical protein DCQ37_02850 [Desulfobacteraceae bacterium]|nr:hypothetical protein [Desulfobacteraceae bacterium]